MKTKAAVILNRSLSPHLVAEGIASPPLRFAEEELRRFGGCCFSGPAPYGEHVPTREALRKSRTACAEVLDYLKQVLPQRQGWLHAGEAWRWERRAQQLDDALQSRHP